MRIATLIALVLIFLVLVYIAVILKKNLANQVNPVDMKMFLQSMTKDVSSQVHTGINNAFAPAQDNVGVRKFVS